MGKEIRLCKGNGAGFRERGVWEKGEWKTAYLGELGD